jgi:toxin ParE1/3/4
MSRVTRRPAADSDLLDIALYIGRDDPEASDRFIDQLAEKFELLATQPQMGRARPELGPDIRSFPLGNYVVFYVEIADGIDVVRVLSGARDIEALF